MNYGRRSVPEGQDGADHAVPLKTQPAEPARDPGNGLPSQVVSSNELGSELGPEAWQWELPPAYPTIVMANIRVSMVKDVDTVNGTVYMRIGIWQRWHDHRVATRGKPRNCPLPKKLWSPRPTISPKLADFECYTSEFQQQQSKEAQIGDLYTLTWFEGHICNKMDLQPFPFDIDDVEFEVRGSECFLRNGDTNANNKTEYRWLLQHETKPSDRFKMGKHIAPHGWSIVATEIEYVNLHHEHDTVKIRIHMFRIWSFYMYKVILPMVMIVVINLLQVFFKVDDLPGKMEHITALFLSTFALLYVVAADLPKTSFQTPIDWVILFTMVVLASSGVIAVLCAYVAGATDLGANGAAITSGDPQDIETANAISTIGISALTALYFFTVCALSVPNYRRMRQSIAALQAECHDDGEVILKGVDDHIAKIKAEPHSSSMPTTLYKPWN